MTGLQSDSGPVGIAAIGGRRSSWRRRGRYRRRSLTPSLGGRGVALLQDGPPSSSATARRPSTCGRLMLAARTPGSQSAIAGPAPEGGRDAWFAAAWRPCTDVRIGRPSARHAAGRAVPPSSAFEAVADIVAGGGRRPMASRPMRSEGGVFDFFLPPRGAVGARRCRGGSDAPRWPACSYRERRNWRWTHAP